MSSVPTTPNPQAPAPQPGAGASASPMGGAPGGMAPEANPLQTMLARIAMMLRQLGSQNVIVQPELQDAAQKLILALQKVSQASAGAAPGGPAAAPAPPQQ